MPENKWVRNAELNDNFRMHNEVIEKHNHSAANRLDFSIASGLRKDPGETALLKNQEYIR